MLNMSFYTQIAVDSCILPELRRLSNIYFDEFKTVINQKEITSNNLIDIYINDVLSSLNYSDLYNLSIEFNAYIHKQLNANDPIIFKGYHTTKLPIILKATAARNWIEHENNPFLHEARKRILLAKLDADIPMLFFGFILTAHLIKELLIFEHPKYFNIPTLKQITY